MIHMICRAQQKASEAAIERVKKQAAKEIARLRKERDDVYAAGRRDQQAVKGRVP